MSCSGLSVRLLLRASACCSSCVATDLGEGQCVQGVEEIDVAKLPDVVDAFPLVKSRLIVLSAAFSGAGKLST